MKILVISKRSPAPGYFWKFEDLSKHPGFQIRVLTPSLIQDFREGFKFYPDIIWVDEEPYCFTVTKWLILKKFFMPWSHVIASANDNFFRQSSSIQKGIEKFNYQNLSGILSNGKTVVDNLLRKRFSGKILEVSGLNLNRELQPSKGEIDAKNLKESLGLQFKVVGYFGPLLPERGLEWLLRSVAKIPLNLSLLFIGNGPQEFALRQWSLQLGIDSRLKIIPDADDSDFLKYYKAMDVLVLPSISTPKWREPFSGVVLEAMKIGLPVIASKSGEIPNEVGDGGILISEGDEPALSEALTKVLKDDAFRAELILKGKAQAASMNPQKTVDLVADFFESIAK